MFLFFLISLFINSAFAEFKPLDPELKDFTYPFPVKFHELSVKDQKFQMAYMDVPPEGIPKETVVLLHGKNFSGNYWEKTANDLLAQGYRVIMPDQIGFGKSSKPEAFPYTFHYLASLTHELVKNQGVDQFILVGHSMGGMVATRLALMFPESVKKLILVNPIGLEDTKTKVPYKNVNENYAAELQTNEEKIRNYQKTVYFDGKWKPEYEKNIEILVGWTLHKDYPKVAWNAALTTDMVFTQPVVYEFKNLKVPTYLLIGTRDRTAVGKNWASPEVQKELGRYDLLGKKIAKQIPKSKLVELSGVGHMPQVEVYDLYWQNLLKFIQAK